MKADVTYEFHHAGYPSNEARPDEVFSEQACMYTADNPGQFKIQWHRFTEASPLHPLIKKFPHLAFKVNNLERAVAGEDVILGPYEPIDDYFVAIINDSGAPVEFIQTDLADEEIWRRAKAEQGALYRSEDLFGQK